MYTYHKLATVTTHSDDWANYEVPALAQILSGDLGAGFDRALAWGRVGGLSADALDSLMAAADELARSWSLETSRAAQRFLDEVATLVARTRNVSEAAYANKSILTRALESFEASRKEVVALADEWSFNASQEQGSMYGDSIAPDGTSRMWRDAFNARAHLTLKASDRAVYDDSRVLQSADPSIRESFHSIDSDSSQRHGGQSNVDEDSLGIVSSRNLRSAPPALGSQDRSPFGRIPIDQSTMPPTSDGVIGGEGLGRPGTAPESGFTGRAIDGQVARGSSADGAPQASDPEVPVHKPSMGRGSPMVDGLREQYPIGGLGYGAGVSGSSTSRSRPRRRRTQSEPWLTASGVPGVLLPAPSEVVHDPGKGVLGIDR